MKKPNNSVHFSWQRISLIVLCAVLAIILAVMIFATSYIHHLLSLVTVNGDDDDINETLSSEQMATATEDPDDHTDFTGPSIDHEDVTIATLPSIPVEELIVDGVVNIMLIGEDRRPGQGRQRSDSMILCSFNKNNNSLTMISFLRDTYVAIPGYKSQKLNAAYQFGGPNLLDQTLATNFGVHVDANIMITFDGFKGVIDLLGGVDIKLTEAEVKHLNKIYNWGLSAGMNHLDGKKALAYSRIRKIDMDAKRAERQRKVLIALINNYKNKSLTEMVSLASQILQTGFIKTDMTSQELVSYVMSLFPMLSTATINNQQIPASGTYKDYSVGNLSYCKLPDYDINRQILKKIFTQG